MATRLKLLAFTVMLFGILCVFQSHNPMSGGESNSLRRAERLRKAVAHYTSLDIGHRDYLRQLVNQRDFEALEAIYNSDTVFCNYAAEEVVENLDSADAVKFCAQFLRGSMNWRSAFLGLKYHPKPFVIEYVMEVILDSDPIVRYCCFTLCRIRHWPDLIDYAQDDLSNMSYLGLPNSEDEIVLGNSAQLYLDSLSGKKRRPILPTVKIPDSDK